MRGIAKYALVDAQFHEHSGHYGVLDPGSITALLGSLEDLKVHGL